MDISSYHNYAILSLFKNKSKKGIHFKNTHMTYIGGSVVVCLPGWIRFSPRGAGSSAEHRQMAADLAAAAACAASVTRFEQVGWQHGTFWWCSDDSSMIYSWSLIICSWFAPHFSTHLQTKCTSNHTSCIYREREREREMCFSQAPEGPQISQLKV